jgi:hypothetical protein
MLKRLRECGRGCENAEEAVRMLINGSTISGPKGSSRKNANKCRPLHNFFSLKTCNDGENRGRLQDPGDSSPRRLLRHRDGSRWKRTDPGRVSLNKGSS